MFSTSLSRALFVFALGFAVLLTGVAVWIYQSKTPTQSIVSSGAALIGGPFELVDQTGATRTEADFRGRHMLIYFGYTFCPDICPTSLLSMSQGLSLLADQAPEQAAQVVPLFITVDPERDTLEVMRGYAEHFHPDLVALTGSADQIEGAAKSYRVYYRKAESENASEYLMDHSGFIYLMDAEGAYMRHFSHSATAEEIAAGLAEALGES